MEQLQTEDIKEIAEKVREIVDEVNSIKDLDDDVNTLEGIYITEDSSSEDFAEAINIIIDVLKRRID